MQRLYMYLVGGHFNNLPQYICFTYNVTVKRLVLRKYYSILMSNRLCSSHVTV